MRIIGSDVNLFNVDGDKLSALRSATFDISRTFVDVSGIAEVPWGVYRLGAGEMEMRGTCIIHDKIGFYDAVFNGSEVYVQFGWDNGGSDAAIYMYAYVGSCNLNFSGRGEPATEEITLRPSEPSTVYIVD